MNGFRFHLAQGAIKVTTLPEVLELRKFVAPEFVFGNGARLLVGRYAANLGASRVLVVTGPAVIAAGWAKEITDNLEDEGVSCVVFSEISPNPREQEVMAGAAVYEREGCDAIVAVGGGSPMDCAKGIGIVSSNKRHILTFKGVDQVPIPSPPLICIPTTSGTSADVSQFAIIVDTQNKVKVAIVSKAVVPDVALIDPATTVTMSDYLTACTGMDALVHAMEAYVSNAHSPITDLHALEAVRLVAGNMIRAIQHPDDMETRGDARQLVCGIGFL
jgi:alcohol dehydrogenase class IV